MVINKNDLAYLVDLQKHILAKHSYDESLARCNECGDTASPCRHPEVLLAYALAGRLHVIAQFIPKPPPHPWDETGNSQPSYYRTPQHGNQRLQ